MQEVSKVVFENAKDENMLSLIINGYFSTIELIKNRNNFMSLRWN